MADNLTVSIGIDTKKMRADLELLKAEFRKTTTDLKKAADAAVASGDKTRVTALSAAYDTLQREIIQTNRAITQQNRVLAGHGLAALGAARGLHALSESHGEVEEMSGRSTREIIKVSKELGTLETNGFAVAKMFKEFPRVAVPVAVAAGVAAAVAKLSNEAYKSITALDDLSKASGFTGREIATLEKVFGDADVGVAVLDKTLRSVGESFDKAKVKSADFGSALSGVQILRGGAGTAGAGVQVLRGISAAPSGETEAQAEAYRQSRLGGFEAQGRVLVMRGGAGYNIDPSKGFAGLVDPNQFKTVEEFFAAVIPQLLKIAQISPSLGREIIRGQGLDPVETLRALQSTTAENYAKALATTAEDQRYGAVPLARRFGAQAEATGRAREEATTAAGIPAMEGATTVLKGAEEGAKALAEQLKQTREEWNKTADALAKGVDSGELGGATNEFANAWGSAFSKIESGWKATVDYMNALRPSATGSQEGQVIPIPGNGMATGGVVPGQGTGDTVPAWLTPGEYVAKRASVAYYGAGLFSALNSRSIPRDLFSRIGYASGGLVGNIASFADGGSVKGSTPVHLHLDGQSFATTATEGVASALVVAARRQQMRSAGVKPSWYGGRAGS